MKKQKHKKFFFTLTEECILNEKFNKEYPNYAGGRIEIFHKDFPYDIEEIRLLLPRELWEGISKVLNFKECDYFQIANVYSPDLEKKVKQLKDKTYFKTKSG